MLKSDGKWVRDEKNRVVILRGVNCGGDSKLPPFEPFQTEKSAEQIRSWGVNVVRYVTVWEAIEPEPDIINKEYIKKMKEKVRWLTERGIYVIVDMHQDLYARKFCGDGAPEWAVFESPEGLLKPCGEEWFLNYFSPPVMKSFTRFWKDEELQEHFLNALKAVVRELKHDVIGFEIFNEPWHGEFDIGFFESKVLTEFYRKAVKIIRKESKDCLIFFEPAVAASPVYGVASQIDKIGKDSVFSPHFYTLGSLLGSEPDVEAAIGEIDRGFFELKRKAAELETPIFIGEFGCHPRQKDGKRLLDGYYRMLDKYMLGGAVWGYSPRDEWNNEGVSLVNPDLTEREYVKVVTRPYPKAVAGEITGFQYDLERKTFRLEYLPSYGETVVSLPKRYFPEFEVKSNTKDWSFDEEKEELVVESSKEPTWIEIKGK